MQNLTEENKKLENSHQLKIALIVFPVVTCKTEYGNARMCGFTYERALTEPH